MKIRCKQCKTTWESPDNRVSEGISWLGEDSVRWRCPSCGRVVIWQRPLRYPAGNYGTVTIDDLEKRFPSEYEG